MSAQDRPVFMPGFSHTTVLLRDVSSQRALLVRIAIRSPTHRASGGPSYLRGEPFAESTAVAFDLTPEEIGATGYRDAPTISTVRRARHLAVKRTDRWPRTDPAKLIAGVRMEPHVLLGEILHGDARIAFDLRIRAIDEPPVVLRDDARLRVIAPMVGGIAEGSIQIDAPTSGRRSWNVDRWRACRWDHSVTLAPFAFTIIDTWSYDSPNLSAADATPIDTRRNVNNLAILATLGKAELRGGPSPTSVALYSAPYEIERSRRWTVGGRAPDGTALHLVLTPDEDDRVGLYTQAEDGTMSYAICSCFAHAEAQLTRPGHATAILTSGGAFLEIITRDATHGAAMFV